MNIGVKIGLYGFDMPWDEQFHEGCDCIQNVVNSSQPQQMQPQSDLHKLGDYSSGKLYINTAFLKSPAKLEDEDREMYWSYQWAELAVLVANRIHSDRDLGYKACYLPRADINRDLVPMNYPLVNDSLAGTRCWQHSEEAGFRPQN